jgi:glycine/D-amino acid oxidase-like deaminating enzyme
MANMSKIKSLSPVANPMPPFWNSYDRPLDDYRSTPELPATCDVLIIGAGFTGVGTAFHLLKDNPSPPSIVMLEARKVAFGATGHNGGHVKPDMYYSVPKYSTIYGAEAAAEVTNFEASHVYAVKNLVETGGLDCDFHLTRAVCVS